VAAEAATVWRDSDTTTRRGSATTSRDIAIAMLDVAGLRAIASVRADQLPTGQARLVEVGRALAAGPRVLLLDEPSSGLDEQESDDLARLLRDLAAGGLAVLLVEHDVQLVMKACSRIHVRDLGSILPAGTPA